MLCISFQVPESTCRWIIMDLGETIIMKTDQLTLELAEVEKCEGRE